MKSSRTADRHLHRILLVSGDLGFCHKLAQVVAECREFSLCGQVMDTASAHEVVAAQKPDSVVADTDLCRPSALDVFRSLTTFFPDLQILATSCRCDAIEAENVLLAGARGFLLKTESPAEILHALSTMIYGGIYASPVIMTPLLRRLLQRPTDFSPRSIQNLTDRELRVFELLGTGLNNREVAEQLHLSHKTIESHRENIKHRLGLDSAAALRHCASSWMLQQS